MQTSLNNQMLETKKETEMSIHYAKKCTELQDKIAAENAKNSAQKIQIFALRNRLIEAGLNPEINSEK